ncbi:MAG: DUF5668 domain-containing protein [Bacteroidota bacterium]
MERQKFSFSVFGVFLIAAGILLLLRQFDILYFGWKKIFFVGLIIFGGMSFISGFANNDRGKIFFGTIGFFIGLYFLLRSLDFIYLHYHSFFPIIFIIIGCAFLFTVFSAPFSFFPVIPALAFGGIGTLLLLSRFGYFEYYDVWYYAGKYWPVVLILLGGSLLLRSKRD